MGECNVSVVARGARYDAVWSMLERPDRWPGVVSGITSVVRLAGPTDGVARTEWEVEIGQAGLWWLGEELYRPEIGRVDFRSIEGDLERLEGVWQISEVPEGARFDFSLSFDVGIPSLRDRVESVAQRQVTRTVEDIAASVLNGSMAAPDAGVRR